MIRGLGRGMWRERQVKIKEALTILIIPQNQPKGLLNFGSVTVRVAA
jgi:hypothetical protein